MGLNSLPNLAKYMNSRLADASVDAEERSHIENFIWDERPPQSGLDLYAQRLGNGPVTDFDDWQNRHRNFTAEEINLDAEEAKQPWTFRADNAINRLRQIDPRINLVRVEDADWLCESTGITPETLREQIAKFQQGDAKANTFLTGIVKSWNAERDQRPLFATTELEITDLINDNPSDWAEQLRDQLGLGHYSPDSGRPIEIILMRYTVQEVLDSLDGAGYPAMPTVLDSGMSPYFFPSPVPDPQQAANPYYGHTVNLALVEKQDDYTMGVELLHPRIAYKPEHFFKMGVIARPVEMPLARARTFHLPWLQLDSGRDDFGGGR